MAFAGTLNWKPSEGLVTSPTAVEKAISEVIVSVVWLSAGQSVTLAGHLVTVTRAVEYTADVVKPDEEAALPGADVTTTDKDTVPAKRTLPVDELALADADVTTTEEVTDRILRIDVTARATERVVSPEVPTYAGVDMLSGEFPTLA